MTLARRLDEIRSGFEASELGAEVRPVLDANIARLIREGVAERALAVGARAPAVRFDGILFGRPGVRLASALERGPIVLTWFRGSW